MELLRVNAHVTGSFPILPFFRVNPSGLARVHLRERIKQKRNANTCTTRQTNVPLNSGVCEIDCNFLDLNSAAKELQQLFHIGLSFMNVACLFSIRPPVLFYIIIFWCAPSSPSSPLYRSVKGVEAHVLRGGKHVRSRVVHRSRRVRSDPLGKHRQLGVGLDVPDLDVKKRKKKKKRRKYQKYIRNLMEQRKQITGPKFENEATSRRQVA